MYTRRCIVFGLITAVLLLAQDAQPSLQVTGAVKQPLTLTADDLAKMPRATVRTTNNGMETVYEGVWLYEILKRAGGEQNLTEDQRRRLKQFELLRDKLLNDAMEALF